MIITSQYQDINDWFFSTIQTLLKCQNNIIIALPGWSSLDAWYRQILNCFQWKNVDLNKIQFWLIDERLVSPNSWERNDRQIWEKFLQPAGFHSSQLIGLWEKVDKLAYNTIWVPDIWFFWLWADGHIASLFPYHKTLLSQWEWYIDITDSPKLPVHRITLSVATIKKIPHTALFVVGNEKQQAYKDYLNPGKTIQDIPAKILTPDIIFLG